VAGLLDLVRELVEIESPTGDTREVGEGLADRLASASGRVEWHGEHVRADFGGREPPLLVLGHLDTVWERGTLAERPFRVDGDRAYGPGICDMKGGLAIALEALRHSQGDRHASASSSLRTRRTAA
jgi:glutamate carboxypeptidase